MVDRIPLDARVILDVGCGSGELAAGFKLRNPAVRYLGVEQDPVLANLAASRMDAVACVDVEATPVPFPGEIIDCIIYSNILEHLKEPWDLLEQQVATLRHNGSVLIRVANMEHWSLVDRLLRGGWDYESGGLLDRGHLRWFNTTTTRRALIRAGLFPLEPPLAQIDDIQGAEGFTHALSPALASLGIDPARFARRSAARQHIWRARRKPVPILHLVSTMLTPVGGVSDVRVTEPLQALASSPDIAATISNTPTRIADADAPRIFVFHRPAFSGPEGLSIIRQVLAEGFLLICEFDDHPGYIPILNRTDVYNFSAVHAVQTSTQNLADVLGRDNPEVTVFPNAIRSLPEVENYRNPARLTMFCASLNRTEDWLSVTPALNAVADMAGERLHFRVVNDRALFDGLRTESKSFTPLCNYETYHRLLATSEFSCMPLLDTPFNRCKSDLKFIEAASHRVTAIASNVAYGDAIVDGRNGLLFETPQELQRKLLQLIANPEAGRLIANAGRDYVSRHRMLAYQVARRAAWYRSLWSRKNELTRALLARVPELLPQEEQGEGFAPRPHQGEPPWTGSL